MSGTFTQSKARHGAANHGLVDRGASSHLARRVAPIILFLLVAAIYSSIYFREQSLSAGIGANLVPAERVLEGEVPYRDFYKIQTPGILFLNAGLFKLWGTTLLTALWGVMVFRVLTVVMVFVVASRIINPKLAIVPALLSMIWLPPGGPFRAAPIQYEMLFILLALYFTLRWVGSRAVAHAFAAGLAVGMVALFKQNVGLYCAIALALSMLVVSRQERAKSPESLVAIKRRSLLAAAVGIVLPVAGLLVYLISNDALTAAIRVFVTGPGEHIQMKLTGYPLPIFAAPILIAGTLAIFVASLIVQKARAAWPVGVALGILAAASAALVPQAAIDNSIFWFAPALFLYGAWLFVKRKQDDTDYSESKLQARSVLLVLLLFSLASFGELFPRSVRGLVIGTLPTVFLLFAFLFAGPGVTQKSLKPFKWQQAVAGVITVVLLVFGLRMSLPHYLELDSGGVRLKADTELNFDRGRRVYFPAKKAAEINLMVSLVQARVSEGESFFAHSLDSASYYFLADRQSQTGATLWNDAGTNDAERLRTLDRLKQKQVRLVLTSEQAMAAERFQPLIDYLQNDFHEALRAGNTIFLERNY